ncbi:MAG TPA: phytoene desaturase family protein [Candidatus Hydrogenedens sp.]|nr:phytoene desaturase family protein [Candidatus Hydrogenedens sp.]
MNSPHIVIIGAGPGGLTAGMILASHGFKVTIFEKDPIVGGRNKYLQFGNYKFDLGPTFLMMRYVLEQVFQLAGRDVHDYLKIYKLNPMYRLAFKDFYLDVTDDHKEMADRIEKLFPNGGEGFKYFMKREANRFKYMRKCLEKPYLSIFDMVGKDLMFALPHLAIGRTVNDVLSDYYKEENLRICFCFQSKYLGMSPWKCPGAFAMIAYVEHEFGIDHVEGGLSEISSSMAKVINEYGGEIYTNTKVERVVVDNGSAHGVVLEDGTKIKADEVIINADFAYAMSSLFKGDLLKKYAPDKLKKKKYSCSTFMLYLGLDKLYDEVHHTIHFADNYYQNTEDIANRKVLSEDFSFYIRNASLLDKTLAPEGHSALYVLVPVPNNTSGIKWEDIRQEYRNKVIDRIKERTTMKDIDNHIEVEHCITPLDWEQIGVYNGATFNLAHNLGQMLYFRPHNKFEEIDHCYLVGGGTHPGSGLPTIYESARITSQLIMGKYDK